MEPTRGRSTFARRKFHNGEDSPRTTSCSRRRARMRPPPTSDALPADTKVVKVDDHTVDSCCQGKPDPARRMGHWTSCRRSGRRQTARRSPSPRRPAVSHAALNATAPAIHITSHSGVKTIFKPTRSVGQARAQFDEGSSPISNDARALPRPSGGRRLGRSDSAAGRGSHQWSATRRCCRERSCAPSSSARSISRRAEVLERQGKNPLRTPAEQGVLSGDRRECDRRQGHAQGRSAVGDHDLAAPLPAREGFKRPAYAPDEAKKLLAEAGYRTASK